MVPCLGECGHPARDRSNYCQACWDRLHRVTPLPDGGRVFEIMVWVLPLAVLIVVVIAAVMREI